MPTLRRLRGRDGGQVLALVALMLFVLLLLIGLAIDAGVVLAARRDLVRVADAAALAGAGALSSGEPGQQNDWVREQRAITRVREYVALNGFDPDLPGNILDAEVSFTGRKTVTVNVTRTVPLVFMPIIGINTATVTAHGEGREAEAAPVDIVLVQDVSGSQCYGNMPRGMECAYIPRDPGHPDNDPSVLKPYDPTKATVRNQWDRWFNYGTSYSPSWRPGCYNPSTGTWAKCTSGQQTTINEPWEPFSLQQTAARYFVSQLDARYDQIALVSFSSNPPSGSTYYGSYYNARTWADLTSSLSTVIDAIGSSPLAENEVGDEGLYPGGSTNMAAGIKRGVEVLTLSPQARENAVAVMILLSDGTPTTRLDGSTPSGCDVQTGEGCSLPRQDTMAAAQEAASKGVIIYTVFVGTAEFAESQALMLQYIADLTDNRHLGASYATLVSQGGPAYNAAWFQDNVSGNYFLASDQEQLERAYDQILERIYTRLTR